MIEIIRMTFLEMVKKKILYVTFIMTAAFLGLYGLAIHASYETLEVQNAVIRYVVAGQLFSLGIYSCGFIISFLSIFSSIGLISSEIEAGTLDAIMAKPISRARILLGKFLGTLAMLMAYSITLIVLVIVMNQVLSNGRSIVLSPYNIFVSTSLFMMLPVVISSIGILLSVKLPTMGSSIVMIILYFIGMIGGMLENIGNFMTGPIKETLVNLGIASSLIMPTDAIYRKASFALFPENAFSAMSSGVNSASSQPSMAMMVYVVVFFSVMLFSAVREFEKRDS